MSVLLRLLWVPWILVVATVVAPVWRVVGEESAVCDEDTSQHQEARATSLPSPLGSPLTTGVALLQARAKLMGKAIVNDSPQEEDENQTTLHQPQLKATWNVTEGAGHSAFFAWLADLMPFAAFSSSLQKLAPMLSDLIATHSRKISARSADFTPLQIVIPVAIGLIILYAIYGPSAASRASRPRGTTRENLLPEKRQGLHKASSRSQTPVKAPLRNWPPRVEVRSEYPDRTHLNENPQQSPPADLDPVDTGEEETFCPEMIVPGTNECVVMTPIRPQITLEEPFSFVDINGDVILNVLLTKPPEPRFSLPRASIDANLIATHLCLRTPDGELLAECKAESASKFTFLHRTGEKYGTLQCSNDEFVLITKSGRRVDLRGNVRKHSVTITCEGETMALTEETTSEFDRSGPYFKLRVGPLTDVAVVICIVICSEIIARRNED